MWSRPSHWDGGRPTIPQGGVILMDSRHLPPLRRRFESRHRDKGPTVRPPIGELLQWSEIGFGSSNKTIETSEKPNLDRDITRG